MAINVNKSSLLTFLLLSIFCYLTSANYYDYEDIPRNRLLPRRLEYRTPYRSYGSYREDYPLDYYDNRRPEGYRHPKRRNIRERDIEANRRRDIENYGWGANFLAKLKASTSVNVNVEGDNVHHNYKREKVKDLEGDVDIEWS